MIAIEKVHSAKRRIAAHYLSKLRQINQAYANGGENASYAIEHFDVDYEQIEQTIIWLEANANIDDAIADLFLDIVTVGFPIFYRRLPPIHSLKLYEKALRIAKQFNQSDAIVTQLIAVARVHYILSDNQNMQQCLEQAYKLAQDSNFKEQQAECLYYLSYPYQDSGQHDRAIASVKNALNYYRKINDSQHIAQSLIRLGRVTQLKDEWQVAEQYLQEAYNIASQHNYQEYRIHALSYIGDIRDLEADYDAAIDYYNQALSVATQLRYRETIIFTLTHLGVTYTNKKDFATAHDYYEQALELTEKTGIPIYKSALLGNLGYTLYLQEDFDGAIEMLQNAARMFREEQTTILECVALTMISSAYTSKNNLDKARQILSDALSLSHELEYKPVAWIIVPSVQLWMAIAMAHDDSTSRLEMMRQAVQWAGLLYSIPNTEPVNREEVDKLRPQMEAILGVEKVGELLKQGKQLNPDTITTELLAELKNINV